ncbi:MAG TPA: hypothetical protein ENK43_04325 [Planctomycetes bacterium]|nr:hypothetical protein [Planctomycetota bacterium]
MTDETQEDVDLADGTATDTHQDSESDPQAETETEAATETDISPFDLDDLGPGIAAQPAPENFGRVLDVTVPVTARVGAVRKTISDVVDLVPGSIIDLERSASEPIDIVVGDKLIARGEIVVVDEHYGIRVVEVIQD